MHKTGCPAGWLRREASEQLLGSGAWFKTPLKPRSPATRFLLADLYLRSGRPIQAMGEMAVLNRFVPASAAGLAPALAAYARDRGTLPQIKAILKSYPELEEPLLAQLSEDARNADAILALASTKREPIAAPNTTK